MSEAFQWGMMMGALAFCVMSFANVAHYARQKEYGMAVFFLLFGLLGETVFVNLILAVAGG